MLKATSYMPHNAGFSMIVDALLEIAMRSCRMTQGSPTSSHRPVEGAAGDYNQPYGSFRWMEQSDLREAYKTTGPKPLPMHVGYGYKRITSNLQLGTRLK